MAASGQKEDALLGGSRLGVSGSGDAGEGCGKVGAGSGEVGAVGVSAPSRVSCWILWIISFSVEVVMVVELRLQGVGSISEM